MNNSPFLCQFQIRYCEAPIISGAVGYGGEFTKEQLRSDDTLQAKVLENLYNIIEESVPIPDAFRYSALLEIIMYLPDLAN